MLGSHFQNFSVWISHEPFTGKTQTKS